MKPNALLINLSAILACCLLFGIYNIESNWSYWDLRFKGVSGYFGLVIGWGAPVFVVSILFAVIVSLIVKAFGKKEFSSFFIRMSWVSASVFVSLLGPAYGSFSENSRYGHLVPVFLIVYFIGKMVCSKTGVLKDDNNNVKVVQNVSNENVSNENVSNENVSNENVSNENVSNENVSNENVSNENVNNILRWIGLLFAIPIVFIATYWIGYFMLKWISQGFYTGEIVEGGVLDSIIIVMSSFISYKITIEIAIRIAPSRKDKVEKVMYILFLILGVVSFTASLIVRESGYLTSIIANILIVCYSSYALITGNDNKKSKYDGNNK